MKHLFQALGTLGTILILIVPAFALGYAAARPDRLALPAPIQGWVERFAPEVGSTEIAIATSPSPELDELFKPFWETWSYVNTEYYNEAALEPRKLSRGAIRGLLGSVDDPYTLYLDPMHRQITEADLRGAFDGIGVQVEMVEQRLRVVSPLEGSPGERAGLRTGDVVTHVDGREVKGLDLPDAIRLIRGPRGTSVVLTIQREGRPPFEVAVEREEIRITAARGEVRSDGVGYVRITNFTLRVGSDLRQTLERLAPSVRRGWVLDLRGNPGGYLDAAISVASQFLDEGVVLYEQRRGGERQEIRTRGRARAASGPMVVLVDKGTASAAEIVAAALRDNGRATLLGEQTYGKGSVQVVHGLSDGSAIRLTVARWLTPKGEPIQGLGLTPEILAARETADSVLEQAIEHIRQQPASAGALRQALAEPLEAAQAEPVEASRPSTGSERPEGLGPLSAAPSGLEGVAILDSHERTAVGGPGLI